MRIRNNLQWFYVWMLTIEPRPMMAILGTFTLTWGLWLAWPASNTFSSSPVYVTMEAVASENIWGMALVIIGGGQLYHSFRRIRWGAVITSMLAAAMWAFIVAAFVGSLRPSTAIPVYTWITIWNAWIAYRVRGERVANGNR